MPVDLNRVAWAESASFLCYGVRFTIRTSREGILPQLMDRLPFGSVPTPSTQEDVVYSIVAGGTRRIGRLYRDGVLLQSSSELSPLFASLDMDAQLAVAELAPGRIFIHAGVVGWRGRAIVLPGRSGAGKTTLVTALIRAGAEYYSDEYAVLDAEGLVHPYPRPLASRDVAGAPVRRHSITEIGGRAGTVPLRAGLVALTRYQTGAEWRPEGLTPGQTLLELLDNAIPARRRPRETLDALHAALSGVRGYRGPRGEAAETAVRLLSMIDTCQGVDEW